MFEKHKAAKAAREAGRVLEQAQAALAEWQHADDVYAWCLDRVRATTGDADRAPIALKAHEHPLHVVHGARLIEPRRGAGHWQGGSQGLSVRVPGTKSMRYRVGATRGTYVQGDERPTVIDSGTFTITDVRAVFVGTKQTREWLWSKLVAFQNDAPDWTGIAVSNREKLSGVAYAASEAVPVSLFLELGSALAQGTVDELVHELELQRAEHAQHRHSLPGSPAPHDTAPA
jgi:hypothetical protein